jgi:pyridoxal phosphate enzyme (YggS family)
VRIARAAERSDRDPNSIRLVAVTKGVETGSIREAIAAGVHDIGENRVQEAQRKRRELHDDANWHLVGHLQTNKAKLAASLFDAVHSVDSERVAGELAVHRPIDAQPLAALIEVELTGRPERTGAPPGKAGAVLRAAVGLPGVHVLGLMTIAPHTGDEHAVRAHFAEVRKLRDSLEQATGWPLPELSMGMTDDFEIAIEEGATMVRIGRGIFGSRV